MPEDSPYETLRRAIIQRVSKTKHQLLQNLLHHDGLGDRKPSQLLRNMQQLLGENSEGDLLQELFVQQLPAHIRPALASMKDKTLIELADVADNMVDIADVPFSVSSAF